MQVTPRVTILFAVALLLACSVASAQKLGGAVGYNLGQIEPRLDKAEKLLTQGDAKNALSYYETAKTQWDAVHRDFKGKFDTNHPQVVAMRKRLDGIAGGSCPEPRCRRYRPRAQFVFTRITCRRLASGNLLGIPG